jgi:hypothetical protein
VPEREQDPQGTQLKNDQISLPALQQAVFDHDPGNDAEQAEQNHRVHDLRRDEVRDRRMDEGAELERATDQGLLVDLQPQDRDKVAGDGNRVLPDSEGEHEPAKKHDGD